MAPAGARAESAKKDRSPSDCRRAFPPELHGRVLHVAPPPSDALLSPFADESFSRPRPIRPPHPPARNRNTSVHQYLHHARALPHLRIPPRQKQARPLPLLTAHQEVHMSLRRSILSAATLAAPLYLGAATIAGAQSSRQLFTWTGRVDREVQIAMRGRDVWTRSGDRNEQSYNRARVESALPRSDGYVRVQQVDGRGDVAVIQQPNSRNDYTTIVRVRDRSGGADRYRISASWDASYSDDRGAYGRGNGRGPRVEPRDRSSDRNDGGWDNGNGNNDSNGGWDRRNGNGGYGNGGYGNNRTVL